MRRIPVVFRPGELSHEEDAQFQNWVEHSRKLPSLVALRASFRKQDVLLERRLRFRYAKRKVNDLLRSHRSHPHGPTASGDTQRSSSRARSDTSSTRSSTGKRKQTDESVEGATAASGAPDQKRPRRQGSLAGAALHTPMTEACPAISPDTGGAPHADPGTSEGAYPPLDSRYATADRVHAAEHHVDEVADQASLGVERLGNQQADRMVALERSNVGLCDLVARLHGQIDLLPLAFHSVLALPRSPGSGPGMA
ncbi:Hypothetical protein PHPALM_36646 [Phytophthora palmivora]|uniref:Uncharacterized protein n=1 Tax=Phytophthora palmivora TaxID=4796 RepID=A0A2P4WZF6_9STRA|nr:Hypothetical protein PHPALM_36646 [Phytophthora palmivora]